MYTFGSRSTTALNSCDPQLRDVAKRALALSPYDFSIIHGFRGEYIQNALYFSGASQLPWPESKHNNLNDGVPNSYALDFGPWVDGRVPWTDTHIFAVIAGCFFASARVLSVPIRWGGDWDSDGSTKDQTLLDWGHVEMII